MSDVKIIEEPCHACGGRGYINVQSYPATTSGVLSTRQTCANCEGSGWKVVRRERIEAEVSRG